MRTVRIKLLILLALVGSYGLKGQIIREIPSYSLNDIASASFDNFGPVIYYNPLICQQAGFLATVFFKAHEYGHHYLGHVAQGLWNADNPYVQQWLKANMENEADRYAVRYWVSQNNAEVIRGWVNVMYTYNNMGDQTHLPSRVRAENASNYYFELTNMKLFP